VEFSGEQKFKFLCHAGLACFNRCCRDINIFLSPYDVLRLSRKLGLDTGSFLQRYALRVQPPGEAFPVVLLKMREDTGLACPFVTERGCSVYDARPWACRMAPVEIRGRNKYGFCFDSDFCLGLREEKEWTVQEWMRNQGNDVYEDLERGFREIPARLKLTGLPSLDDHIRDMFFLACYDLDRFRRFALHGSFLRAFGVNLETAAELKEDDVALMQFGFRWLGDGFDLRKSVELRDEVFGI